MRVLTHKQIHDEIKDGKKLIMVNNYIYDIKDMVDSHPGGIISLMNHIGKDCIVDYNFHSYKAQTKWNKLKIGRLERTGIYRMIFGK